MNRTVSLMLYDSSMSSSELNIIFPAYRRMILKYIKVLFVKVTDRKLLLDRHYD